MSATISQLYLNKHGHHVVFGAGLIGCYLGGALVHAKQEVTLIGRERFLEQVQSSFTISDYTGNSIDVQPTPICLGSEQLSSTFHSADSVEFLWVTLKCTMLEDALTDIRHVVGKNTIIICCQNGVNTHQVVSHAFPHHKVIRAMVPFNVVNDNAGIFHRGSEGDLHLEIVPEIDSTIIWLARQINTSVLPVNISYHMTELQWAKLQLNMGNGVNALANIPVQQMLETAEYRKFIAILMQELLKVTDKQKIKLPKLANLPNKYIPLVLKLPNFLFKLVAHKMLAIDPKVKTSMWWDLKYGKETEVSYINGKVVLSAKQLDISTPANSYLVSMIEQAEKGERISASEFKEAIQQFK